ncbi:MAG: phage holin family protein [Armatimonadetes bacterium]|nr:phage holin family protein [Armatimonadota bacterium]
MPQRYPSNLFTLAAWLQDHQDSLGIVVGAASWGFACLFGAPGGNQLVTLAFSLMALNVGTGLLKGLFWQSLCEEIGWHGMKRRVAMALFIAFGHQIDVMLPTPPIAMSAFAFIVSGQLAVSILSNIAAAGVMIPASVQQLVERLFQNAAEDALASLGRAAKAAETKEVSS